MYKLWDIVDIGVVWISQRRSRSRNWNLPSWGDHEVPYGDRRPGPAEPPLLAAAAEAASQTCAGKISVRQEEKWIR